MSNTIWLERQGERIASMSMANSVTGHFLAMLILSGSALAATEAERDLIVFFAWHDQYWRGRGNVDFCINEMPWDPALFDGQRAFLDRVIEGALARTGWEKVDGWTPDVEVYAGLLERFGTMLRQLAPEDLKPLSDDDWEPPADPILCPVHDVLAYDFYDDPTCLICHI